MTTRGTSQSSNQGPSWCTIESDPGVFTELISKFGVKDVQVEEVWDLEEATFQKLYPIYGLIFLFKYDRKQAIEQNENALDEIPEGLFFSRQMINNACGTQAILSVLLNAREKIDLGKNLNDFYNFTCNLDPESRGYSLQNQDDIRLAHNSFARPEPISIEQSKDDDEEEDAFHFIAYVPYNGFLYEIDGLQKGPRLIGDCEDKNWIEIVRPAIQERMSQYQEKEIRFNLLAICKNLQSKYVEEIKELEISNHDLNDDILDRIQQLKDLIDDEKLKHTKWKKRKYKT